MFWVVLGLVALAIALLIVGMSKARGASAPASVQTSAPAADPEDAPSAALAAKPRGDATSETNDDGGTTLAADAKSSGSRGRVSMSSQTMSQEIDISIDSGEGDAAMIEDEPTGPVAKILVSAVGGTDQG